MENIIISILVLASSLFAITSATSDPNVYRKNQTESEDFEDPSKYVAVNLIDQLAKSRFNEKLKKFYFKNGAPTLAFDYSENGEKFAIINSSVINKQVVNAEIIGKKYNRKLIESAEMFEGDIRDVSSIDEVRNAVIDPRLRWPKAIIPYVISTDFSKCILFEYCIVHFK